MLACAQDIFFTTSSNSDSSTNNNNQFNDPKDKRPRQHRHVNNNQFQPQQHILHKDINSNKEKEEVCLFIHVIIYQFLKEKKNNCLFSNKFGHQMLKMHLLKVIYIYTFFYILNFNTNTILISIGNNSKIRQKKDFGQWKTLW